MHVPSHLNVESHLFVEVSRVEGNMSRIDFFCSILFYFFAFLCCLYKQVTTMAQSHAVGRSVQQTLQQNVDEPVPLKRKKKDPWAPVGKSVVVLKSSNVTIRNDSVFMPNTIEMAQLKKKEKGQFLTNVQISSKMTQQDIKELLISLFPYLGDQR